MPVKVLIADDHPIVFEGLRAVAKSAGIEVVGQVDSPEKIGDLIASKKPAVLVTEVRIDGHDVLKAIEKLGIEKNGTNVVVFTGNENPTNIARASALGCHDFLLKSAACSQLIDSIMTAAAGKPTPESSLLVKTKSRMRRTSNNGSDSPLTSRETQVLNHVSMGLSNREIGKSLGISVETVKEHVQNILRKLDVNDRTQAAVWAIKTALI